MSNIKLVISIIKFLKDEAKRETFTPDTRESLEVAVQCLETAYDIDSKDPRLAQTDLNVPRLDEIFNSVVIGENTEGTQELKKAELMKNLGNNCMKSNQFSEAIKYYTAAIDLDSHNAIYYGNRAAAYSKLNDFKSAIADCEKAIEIDPKYAKAYGRMGLAYASLGNHDKAKEAFLDAMEIEPDNLTYANNLRLALEKDEGNYEQKDFKAKEHKPSTASASSTAPPGGLNIDWGNLFNNPAFRNMASTLMQDQNLINALSAGMGNVAPPPQGATSTSAGAESSARGANPTGGTNRSFDMLLEAGQYLAAQMQAANPDLVEQLRQTASRSSNPPNTDKKDSQ